MRYRSAMPALRRQFRKIPNWRQRKCTGDTTAIITITTTIIVCTAGIITTIAIIITVIGTGGKGGSFAQISSRPVSPRACLQFDRCHQTGGTVER
jgi:hypothetical protein